MAAKKKEAPKKNAPKEEAPLSEAELAALGYGSDKSVPLGGRMWPKIRVEKTGLSIVTDKGTQPTLFTEGVIAHHHPYRSYYATKDPSNAPPDCFSVDGITGSRFGACGTCNYTFDAAMKRARASGQSKTTEQTCKEAHNLYVVRDAAEGPLLLKVPTMSLKNLKAFFGQITHHAAVITRFASKLVRSGNVEYGQLTFESVRPAPRDLLIQIAPMAKNLQLTATRQAALPEHAESSASPNTF